MSRLEARLNQAWLHKGPLAISLLPLAGLMGTLVGFRRLAYRMGWLTAGKMPVPVVVVGNRIVGGAGKTPSTIALLAHLKAQGWRPGVLTRGYKAELPEGQQGLLIDAVSAPRLSARQTGDEPMLIWRRTGAPIMVNRDRAAGGLALLQAHPELDILVCDDGLQHLRLQRDIEVIVFDGRGAGTRPVRAAAGALQRAACQHSPARPPGHQRHGAFVRTGGLVAWPAVNQQAESV